MLFAERKGKAEVVASGEETPPSPQDNDEEAAEGEEEDDDDDDDEEGEEDDAEAPAPVNSRTNPRAVTPNKPRTNTLTEREQLHNALATIEALTKAKNKRDVTSNPSGGAPSNKRSKQLLRKEGIEKGLVAGDVMNTAAQCVKSGRFVLAILIFCFFDDAPGCFLEIYIFFRDIYMASYKRFPYNLVLICICFAGCNRAFNVAAFSVQPCTHLHLFRRMQSSI